jgi:hypothetical protein
VLLFEDEGSVGGPEVHGRAHMPHLHCVKKVSRVNYKTNVRY